MDYGLVLSLVTQVVAIGIAYGVLRTRIEVSERDIQRIEKEVTDNRVVREDLAVLKSQLANIQLCLNSLVRKIETHPEN